MSRAAHLEAGLMPSDAAKQEAHGIHHAVYVYIQVVGADLVCQQLCTLPGGSAAVDSAHVHAGEQPPCQLLRVGYRGSCVRVRELADAAGVCQHLLIAFLHQAYMSSVRLPSVRRVSECTLATAGTEDRRLR